MRLYAFQGIYYAPKAGRSEELAAPPYDQIDDRARDELHARSPFQIAHLTRPVSGDTTDPYQHAAVLHQRWLEEGALTEEPDPTFYLNLIELAGGGQRLGLCGLVGLEAPDSGVIRPHEETLEKPLADRLALLQAMRVDLEPVLLLSDDEGTLDRMLAEDLAHGPDLIAGPYSDADGNRHSMYRLRDPDRGARYQQILARVPSVIADGHHRYKVASLFAAEVGAAQDTAAAAKLAIITSLASPTLGIEPIHRGIARKLDPTRVAELEIERATWTGENGEAFAAAVAEAEQPALGVFLQGEPPEIWQIGSLVSESRRSRSAAQLPVVVLHDLILSRLGIDERTALGGQVAYRSEPEALWESVLEGSLSAGFFLPPMSPRRFAEATADGDLLPPKSTRFLPKVVSGLVWARHDSRLA